MRSQIRFEADPARVRRTGHCPEGSQELAGGAAKRNHRCEADQPRTFSPRRGGARTRDRDAQTTWVNFRRASRGTDVARRAGQKLAGGAAKRNHRNEADQPRTFSPRRGGPGHGIATHRRWVNFRRALGGDRHCPEGTQKLARGVAKRNHRCGAPEGRGEGDNRLVLTGG